MPQAGPRLTILGLLLFTALTAWTPPGVCQAGGGVYEKALMSYEHGLAEDSKRLSIEVVHSTLPEEERAKCMNLLAVIALDEGKPRLALATWRQLVKEYPKTPEAMYIEDKLPGLITSLEAMDDAVITDPLARAYLNNGDSLSGLKGKRLPFTAPAGGPLAAGLMWYERVISDFPGTAAARQAHRRRLMLLTEDPAAGPDKIVDAFRAFENAFAQDATLEPFRYRIARILAEAGRKDEARQWYEEIVRRAGTTDNLYKDLAQRELK